MDYNLLPNNPYSEYKKSKETFSSLPKNIEQEVNKSNFKDRLKINNYNEVKKLKEDVKEQQNQIENQPWIN